MFTATDLLAQLRAANAARNAALSIRPAGWPRADWLGRQGYRNVVFYAADTAFASRPQRDCYMVADGYHLLIRTTAGRPVESIDLRAVDADERLARYA